jgi:hypothetical protein
MGDKIEDPVADEISQTPMTNRKQGNLDQIHAVNIINPN